MIDGYTYRQKNKLLFAAAAITMIIVLLVPVRKTYSLFQENQLLDNELLMGQRAPQELVFYRQEMQALQKVIHFNASDLDLKEDILTNAAMACNQHQTVLINLQAPKVHTENDFRIETYEVILKGDYINLLKVLVYMENHLVSGKIVAARFLMEKNDRTKHLMAHIYVQTSKDQSNEKMQTVVQ